MVLSRRVKKIFKMKIFEGIKGVRDQRGRDQRRDQRGIKGVRVIERIKGSKDQRGQSH